MGGRRARPVVLSPDRSVHGLLVLEREQYETIRLDVVLPVLHGKLGEDGAIQGLLELSGIPYVGCDVQSSALCMDKSLAYLVAEKRGHPDAELLDPRPRRVRRPRRFPYPVFVKPARSGSSFGVSKVDRRGAADAVETARQYDAKVLIEEGVVGSEVGCAILGNGAGWSPARSTTSRCHTGSSRSTRRRPRERSDNATFIVPADISGGGAGAGQGEAQRVYRALGCSGLARVDMFLKADGTVVLNEVNTLPGLTRTAAIRG